MATRREVSSGAIAFKVNDKGVFVAFIRDAVGKMTFPKGHVERGETIETTARREAFEEAGLEGLRLVRKLGRIQISFVDRFVRKGDTVVKDIHYFLFEAPGSATLRRVPMPSDGERIRGVRWVALGDTKRLSEYEDMTEIVHRAVDCIARQVQKRYHRDPFALARPPKEQHHHPYARHTPTRHTRPRVSGRPH
jgi:8-oxo-dGTP pyrophosphatase MutT (NUDIX family)